MSHINCIEDTVICICKHNNNTQLTSSVLLSLMLLQTRLYLLEVTMNTVHYPTPIATHNVTVHNCSWETGVGD